MKIDIELQEGLDAIAVVERQPKERKPGTPYEGLKIHRLSELQVAASNSGNFADFFPDKTSPDRASLISKSKFVQFWHKIFGNIVDENAPIKFDTGAKYQHIAGQGVYKSNRLTGVSDQALEKLIEYRAYFFEDGINIDELPQGFLALDDPTEPGKRVLHYDEHIGERATIAPKLPPISSKPILSVDLTEQLIGKSDKFYAQLWAKMDVTMIVIIVRFSGGIYPI